MFKKIILGIVLGLVSFGVMANPHEQLVRDEYKDPAAVQFKKYTVLTSSDTGFVTAMYEIGYNKSKTYHKHTISRRVIKFVHDTIQDGGEFVVYEANAKNGYGAYTGYKRNCLLVMDDMPVRHPFIHDQTCPWFHIINNVVNQSKLGE